MVGVGALLVAGGLTWTLTRAIDPGPVVALPPTPVSAIASPALGGRSDPGAPTPDRGLTPLDGAYLFSSNRSGSYQIHLSRAGQTVRLTDDDTNDHWWPRLSPDGSTILLSRSPASPLGAATPGGDESTTSLWTMRPDGSGLTERIPAGTFGRLGPARWSPDGRQVAFAASDPVDGRWRLWLADAERFEPRPVTDRAGVVLDPAFSPDGTHLAYVAHPARYRGDPTASAPLEVFVTRLDGGGEVRLTFDDRGDRGPAWSPDGRLLAVETEVDANYKVTGRWALRIVSVASGEVSTVPSAAAVNLAPSWNPSGDGLVFHRYLGAGEGFRLAMVDLVAGRTLPLALDGRYNDVQVEPVTGPPGWP